MAKKLFGLTAEDLKYQKQINARVQAGYKSEKPQRRRARRPANGRGGTSSIVGSYAVLLEDLPASEITGTGFPYSIPPVALAAKILRYTDAHEYDEVSEPDWTPFGPYVLSAVNPTDMPIKAGMVVPGNIIIFNLGEENEDRVFEVQWSDYKHGISGFVSGNDQSIGHDASGELEHQDDGPCE